VFRVHSVPNRDDDNDSIAANSCLARDVKGIPAGVHRIRTALWNRDGEPMTTLQMRHTDEQSSTRFEARAQGPRWLERIGLLNDYVRVPYANGSSFASQFLYRELETRGHDVSVIGPYDPDAKASELPLSHVTMRSVPLRNHPGVHLAMPSSDDLSALRALKLDLVLGQTSNALMDAGVWLRDSDGVPLVMVNTVHLPSVYNSVLPDSLQGSRAVHAVFQRGLVPFAESQTVNAYNRGDGLVVLSSGLERYWRERGVTVPIHVIPRAIETKIFGRAATNDPFDPRTTRGKRILVVCRHVREKGISRLLSLLASEVFPRDPRTTLTLVGDGPDHDAFREEAESLGIADRCFFMGEQRLPSMPDWYAHADVFVYTSLSETYGQVISEALYSGVPVVAFADGMGVSDQIAHREDGILVDPGPDEADADREFGAALLSLLDDVPRRRAYSERAKQRAAVRCDPLRSVARYYAVFESAREHRDRTWRPRAFSPAPIGPLVRWAGMHSLVAGLGLLREPAIVNRHGAEASDWSLRRAV